MKILIANRGEIARRIIRTAHRLGHETVAIYATPDANAPHTAEATEAIEIGPADLAASYLSIERIVAAAQTTGATAVHPGYGFLAENAEFARACIATGLTWIGPNPDVIAGMGSKIEARQIAVDAGVPVIPGWSDSQDPAQLQAAAERIGWPILVKAAAGGGGKGIRIAPGPDDFAAALTEASEEARRSFGDGDVIVERYIQRPRHVEVQVIADRHGAVGELGTRECSVQRRYQKVLEEAPAPNLDPATRSGLRQSAVRLAQATGYDSAGTVEFIVDDETGDYFFLEMNTRLQVEHPVTEMITGVDLVEAMIRVAGGEHLPAVLGNPTFSGHAFEARILAEDAANDFAPQIGTVGQIAVPTEARWDSAIVRGSEITPHYDSMVAKLIVHGATRHEALAKMRAALDELVVDGVVTTAGFHRWLVDQPPVVAGRVTTRFLDETPIPSAPEPAVEQAAAAWAVAVMSDHDRTNPWAARPDFSLTPFRQQQHIGLRSLDGQVHEVEPSRSVTPPAAAVVDLERRRVAINVEGHTHTFDVPSRTERWAPTTETRIGSGEAIVAPFPAVVSEINVAAGDVVAGDQVLVVIEAMKMLHSLKSTGVATVSEVRVAPGDQVATDQVLIMFETTTNDLTTPAQEDSA